jgi:tripartite-type tricarboxylate transporter receptor subunit TctC
VKTLLHSALLLATLAFAGLARAEVPLRLVVPFAPGGGGDALARVLAPLLSRELRSTVLVENMPGANGVLAMQRLKAAAASERILVLASDHAAVIAPLVQPKAGYETRNDFASVAFVARYPYALAAHVDTGGISLGGLCEALRAHRVLPAVAVPAEGGVPELVVAALGRCAKTPVTTIPFRGGNPAALAVVSGEVPAAVVGISNLLAHHAQAKVRIVAVTGLQRSPLLPDVPTFAEAGISGLATGSGWTLLASRQTAMDLPALNVAVGAVLAQASVQAKLAALGLEPVRMDMAQSSKELATAIEDWKKLIADRKK